MRRGLAKCGFQGRAAQFTTIYQPSTPTDGETKPTWTILAQNVPCSRRHTRGREVVSGNRMLGLATEVVSWRFRGDVTSNMRLRFASTSGTDEVLEILTVGNPDGARQWETAECNRLEST